MKCGVLTAKVLLSFYLLLAFVVSMNSGCNAPAEYGPQQDSLVDPPAPPELLFPPDDTEYVLIANPGVIHVLFDWTSVTGTCSISAHVGLVEI